MSKNNPLHYCNIFFNQYLFDTHKYNKLLHTIIGLCIFSTSYYEISTYNSYIFHLFSALYIFLICFFPAADCNFLLDKSSFRRNITVVWLQSVLYSHWCRGVCGGGTLSKEGLPGFGSTFLRRPKIPGSGLPGFQSDLKNHIGDFTLSF